MSWVDQYIGIPHAPEGRAPPAWDCYGCIRYVLAVHASIYEASDPTQIDRSRWRKIEGRPQPFDLVEMRGHAAVFVTPDLVLHCEKDIGTVCVPVGRLRLPVRGIWRHESRA
jgi:hypothetical protein